jgi:hypothetical protein
MPPGVSLPEACAAAASDIVFCQESGESAQHQAGIGYKKNKRSLTRALCGATASHLLLYYINSHSLFSMSLDPTTSSSINHLLFYFQLVLCDISSIFCLIMSLKDTTVYDKLKPDNWEEHTQSSGHIWSCASRAA